MKLAIIFLVSVLVFVSGCTGYYVSHDELRRSGFIQNDEGYFVDPNCSKIGYDVIHKVVCKDDFRVTKMQFCDKEDREIINMPNFVKDMCFIVRVK